MNGFGVQEMNAEALIKTDGSLLIESLLIGISAGSWEVLYKHRRKSLESCETVDKANCQAKPSNYNVLN